MHLIKFILLACGTSLVAAAVAAETPRERLSFNADWRFFKGDAPDVGNSLTYERVKAWVLPTGDELLSFNPAPHSRPNGNLGEHLPFARPDFDDSTWRKLDLPHDWGIEGPFRQELPGDTGKLPWFGTAWYRKTFTLPADDAGRRVELEIDGAMSYALVWCNGHMLGGWPYGYTSWRVDLTPYLKPGASNVVAIRLDNLAESSRWYPGGGLYRNVWLLKTAPVRVAPLGVFVTTPTVSDKAALVDVGLTLENRSERRTDLATTVQLFSADGFGKISGEPLVSSEPQSLRLEPGQVGNVAHTLTVANPRRWSLRDRHRYVAVTTVTADGRTVDRVETPFGIRTITVSPEGGFVLNGERIPLNGVCNHHDLGALGTAINMRALERQLEILQAMGCNAIRTSHNPPAPELLELCDRLGFLVMVEAFDCWQMGKCPDDYSRVFDEWHEKDLRAMVRRDRNHPCVAQWSIGNEVREQTTPAGWKLAAHLAAIVREDDRTRPITSGFNHVVSGYNGFQTAVDIVGYNYKPDDYAKLHRVHPQLVIQGSETASTVTSRGEYFFPVSDDKSTGRADFQVSSYDLAAPPWAWAPDVEWKGLDENPFVLGEFVWTGFDYIGEPTPYNSDETNLLNFSDPADQARIKKELDELGKIAVPSRSSYFGIIDLAGFPKDRYYLYQARWRPELPMAHILPHWTWPARVGQITPVHVYTSGDEAELFLNGKSLGRKKLGALEYRLRWDDVVYAPGELKVIAYRHGAKWAEAVQRTAGAAAKLAAQPDRSVLRADGSDLAFITVSVRDTHDVLVPQAKNAIAFRISGPGVIAAVDNGDATSFEPFQASQRKAYNGLALVIVRTKAGERGAITLTAESSGLTASEVVLKSE